MKYNYLFLYIVFLSLQDFDIETREDAKAALDMMFKISYALHFVTKMKIDNPHDKSKEYIANLEQKKSVSVTLLFITFFGCG